MATVVRTQHEVADFFGVAIQTVRLWASQGMPGRPGKYSLKEIATWKQTRLPPGRPPSVSKSAAAESPDSEWKRHRATLMKLRVDREKSLLVDRGLHEKTILRMCATFRNGLLAAIPTLAAQLGDLDERGRRAMLERRFGEILDSVRVNATTGTAKKKRKSRGASV